MEIWGAGYIRLFVRKEEGALVAVLVYQMVYILKLQRLSRVNDDYLSKVSRV